ncbi:MAG: glutamate racemase [Nitrospiraceae bacterium]|nr:MAG: glutamate racemase [Nitrospiraceae bacterium]
MPVGVFDSGVGGLTVMREIIKALPDEHILYFGDTARVPYGVRSPETVLKYSVENSQFLMSQGIKLLVIACNTSSAVSLETLRVTLPVPVIGVVEPGARAAVALTKKKKVAVIGTETTINSSSYEKAIRAIDDSISVSGIACPLFVPLIEEGWLEGDVVRLTAEKYLAPVRQGSADTLVLGCTHYPMIKEVIRDTVRIALIDSAVETAREVKRMLGGQGLLRAGRGPAKRHYFVTDSPEKFIRVGERFLDHRISNITKISLDSP